MQSVQPLPSGPLPTTLQKTASPAGRSAPAPAASGTNLAPPPSVRQEVRSPSPRVGPGVVKELSSEEEVPEGAVAFVFVYVCVGAFAMAFLLLYVYRSLTSGRPGAELSTDETSTLSASKQLAVSEERELGRGTTLAVPRPLGSSRGTATSRKPRARGDGGPESAESTSTVARTNGLDEGNVSRTSFEKDDEAGRTAATSATPDDDRRSFELVRLAASRL
ncbi:hypothetical protein MTO96_024580 [Rhipicephalus appendiculatus]